MSEAKFLGEVTGLAFFVFRKKPNQQNEQNSVSQFG